MFKPPPPQSRRQLLSTAAIGAATLTGLGQLKATHAPAQAHSSPTITMANQTPALNYTYFMLVKTTAAWLKLSVQQRFEFLEKQMVPLLKKHRTVQLRFFDSEAFSGRFSDVLMWETAQVPHYQAVVEELRETPFWGTYFEILEIVPAIENAYAIFNNIEPLSAS